MKNIYLLLSRSPTVVSKTIHLFVGGQFTHISLAITPETDKFYSYSRRRLYNFLIGGFIREDTRSFVFARFPDTPCALYELSVSDEAYDVIKAQIEELNDNYENARYSLLGALVMRMGIIWRRDPKFTCSQFVAVLLDRCGEVKMPKDPYLMIPNDFLKIEGIRKIYEGKISECNFSQASVIDK